MSTKCLARSKNDANPGAEKRRNETSLVETSNRRRQSRFSDRKNQTRDDFGADEETSFEARMESFLSQKTRLKACRRRCIFVVTGAIQQSWSHLFTKKKLLVSSDVNVSLYAHLKMAKMASPTHSSF